MKVINGLYYTKEHEWIKVEGSTAYIGITDFAQHSLGSIVFVELPEEGTELSEGDSFGVVESVKAASDIYSPLSCSVKSVNNDIVDDPALLNSDCYENWMIKVNIHDETELDNLMDAAAYTEFTGKE
jgi:glycine cleavage system H protein